MKDSVKSVYIDTSAISKMKHDGFWRLLAAAKDGKLNVFISEVVIWEKIKGRHNLPDLFLQEDDGIPLNAAFFKNILQAFGVKIIEHNDSIIKKAEEFINNELANFDKSVSNELRDAHILAAAFCELDENTIVASNDGGFIDRMPNLLPKFSFVSGGNINNFVDAEGIKQPDKNPCNIQSLTEEEIKAPFSVSFLSVLPILDPDSFKKYQNDLEHFDFNKISHKKVDPKLEPISQEFGKLETTLSKLNLVDTEIRRRVLGYTQWFSPIGKDTLFQLLEKRGYVKEQIENNAHRLVQENLLIDTENHWLTNNQDADKMEICEQAMAVVMPEILDIMELT